ncbi:MAG: tyrosine/phenylalanine carboxypeptidase domain-containing protein, partial [Chromatiaceae bacterium]
MRSASTSASRHRPSSELDRLRRLADRVIAIQMAIDGADFLEVYDFFMERTGDADQAFESARRVFRGGVLTGGAPFTKDVVYSWVS